MNKQVIEQGKLEKAMIGAATIVASEHVESGMVLGLGSGAAVSKFARVLGERVRKGELKQVSVAPSSMQAWLLAKENGLNLCTDSAHCPSVIDVVVDGADQISTGTRAMIKGGGGALLREKIILSASKHVFILIDSTKVTEHLTKSVPVEVVQFALEPVRGRMQTEFEARPALRRLDKGFPFFTESGNVILDCEFSAPIENPAEVESSIKNTPGVVEAGIFTSPVDKFYIGSQDGVKSL